MTKLLSFFVMTQKGFYVLQKYLEDFGTSNLDCIIIGRDNHLQNDYFNELADLCEKNNLKYFERTSKFVLKSEYAISISWRWIIDSKIKLIILHDSLLPRYRGFAPLVSSLINNEKKIGVTALFADKDYDKGDIILQEGINIKYPIKIKEAISLILPIYYNLINKVVTKIINSLPLESRTQNEKLASYSLWRDENDYNINWFENSAYIRRFIDAVGEPYSGASTSLEGEKIRIFQAHEELDVTIENRTPGKIIFLKEGEPVVVCGKGLLRIEKMINDDTRNDVIPMIKFRLHFK